MKLCLQSILSISIIFCLFVLSGCIKDDDECDYSQKLIVSLYSKSLCETDTVYPAGVKDIILCVFDKNDVLVTYVHKEGVILKKGYTEEVSVSGKGIHTVVVWSGINTQYFEINQLQLGKTTKEDWLFRLKRSQHIAVLMEDVQVYTGESRAVYLDGGTSGISEHTSVNLQEITNRLTISVEGLDRNKEEYEVYIESGNGSMKVSGSLADDETVRYNPVTSSDSERINEKFYLLKLETGHNNTIVIRNKISGKELYRGSLLGTLLLKNPEVDLNCDHDFIIKFTAQDQCECGTYTIKEIWVNNWLVHSYDAEM
ncbi:FimB/Mfa2 family fimbrial subunit [Bacteroides sp.]|uniref:FimB/Mfa2 family fimbrial subunit n=1 Tax=Bacteroides sp. TaxID=29523 RepID=UPI0025C2D3FF|nr:FimB/Mfa2 family fimbrial subunit [Bacteroides sp.]